MQSASTPITPPRNSVVSVDDALPISTSMAVR